MENTLCFESTFFATSELFSIIRRQWVQDSQYSALILTLFFEWKNCYTDFFTHKMVQDYVFETDFCKMEREMIYRFPVLSLAVH